MCFINTGTGYDSYHTGAKWSKILRSFIMCKKLKIMHDVYSSSVSLYLH